MTTNPAPILITGAAQRIGFALAKHFIAKGQPLIVSYRTRHSSITELEKAGVICLHADFDCDNSINAFIEQVKNHTRCLRAIIHNASSWDKEADHPLNQAELFDNMMRLHAKVPYLVNQGCAPLLLNHSQPSDIIHLTDYTVETGSTRHIAYTASKAALDNLTKSFARLWAPQIKVNAIAPSLIIFNDNDSLEYREKTLQKSLMGIEPGCQEVINSVELLLNSQYITGRSLPVDGGRHLK